MDAARDRSNRDGYGLPQRWVDRTGGPSLAELDPFRWHPDAACRDLPPHLWLDDYLHTDTSPGIAICRSCPVRRLCLASALVYGDEYGVYGGTTTLERAALARRLRRGATLGQVLASVLDPDSRSTSASDRGVA